MHLKVLAYNNHLTNISNSLIQHIFIRSYCVPNTILCAEAMEFSKTKSLVLQSLHSSGVRRQKTNCHVKSENGKRYEKNKDKRIERIPVVRLL